MKITVPGKDVIKVSDDDFYNNKIIVSKNKIHLIKFDFINVTSEKIKWVLNKYPKTNRFIINNNIKIYNNILKKINKKYYIENNKNLSLISFFKKNNKVLLNFLNLDKKTFDFIINNCFDDVLYNTEVIYISNEIYEKKKSILDLWKGNVIIKNNYNL
jgi:hypothetical protein